MSAATNIACVRAGSSPLPGALEASSFLNASTTSPPAGRPVIRIPEQLHLHHALEELSLVGAVDGINEAARLKHQAILEPVLITTDGTVLAGFGRWQLALFEHWKEIECIEYPLSEEESLPFILTHHRARRGWNAFVRIRLALRLEPYYQQRALENMRAGGKYKGSASLPEVQRIDVRQEIASLAGVGARNVSNVKTILKVAHPRLIEALRNGTVTINTAMQLCKLPRTEQVEQFVRRSEERAIDKVIRRSLARPKQEEISPDVLTVLEALRLQEAREPGSVVLRVGPFQRTVVLLGKEVFTTLHSQRDLELT